MESHAYIEVARKVLSLDAVARERAADEVTDWLNAYSPSQASSLATLLSAVAACEKKYSALEAELHAILELMTTGHVHHEDVSLLQDIQVECLPHDLREYLADVLEG